VAKRLLSEERFKSHCIELTEQIVAAQQRVGILKGKSTDSEKNQLEIEEIELQIETWEAELSELLDGLYFSHFQFSHAGGRFSKEQMKDKSWEIVRVINASWEAIQKVKQNLQAYESKLKERQNITNITINNPIAWCDRMNLSIREIEQRINQIKNQNNAVNAILYAEERSDLKSLHPPMKSQMVFLV